MNRGIIGKRLLSPSNRVSSFSANGTVFTLDDIYEASYSSEGLTSQWVKNKYSPLSTKYPILENTNSFSFASQTTAAQCCTMSEDGTKLYIASNTIVYTYNLSTAFDVTTAVFSSSWTILGETTAKGMYFKPDGTRLFIIGQTGDDITWYDLSEAWNASSASLVSQQVVGSTGLTGLTFNSDGTKLFVIDLTADLIYAYDLGTAWTPSSLGTATTYPISTATGTSGFIEFNSDGTKMYVGDNVTTTDKYLLVYKLTTAYDITTATLQGRLSLMELLGAGYPTSGLKSVTNVEDFRFSNSGNNGLFLTSSVIWNVPLPSTREFSFFSQTSAISYLNSVSEGQGIFFKPDGTRYYITDSLDDAVYEYSMTTPWDISTSGLVRTERNFFTQDGNATDIWFKPDGTIMYLIGNDNDNIYQYTLGTAWDISTATYSGISFYVGYEETSPTSFCLSEDGVYLFVVGSQNNIISRYTLSVPWFVNSGILDSYSHYTTPIGEGNRSLYFEGVDTSYVSLDGTGFNWGTGDFTVECWVYIPNISRDNPISRMSLNSGWSIRINDTGELQWSFSSPIATSTTKIQANTWTHVAVSREGTDLRLFINGNLDTTVTHSGNYIYSGTVYIGSSLSTGFLGNIYGLRFVGGQAVYTESFVTPVSPPTTTAETLLKTAIYSSIIDGSTYNRTLTVSGTVEVNTAYPFSSSTYLGAVLKPDGTKSYLLNKSDYKIYQYSSGNSTYNFVNITPEKDFYVGNKTTSPEDFFINNDGNKLFILDSGTKEIIQYNLTDAWNISSSTFQYDVLVSELELTPTKFTFNSDGKKLFVYGSTTKRVVEYDLSESWNIATASIITNSIVSPTIYGGSTGILYEIAPSGISVANNGNTLYILGRTTDEIREFPLDVPYDLYTARYHTTNYDATHVDPQGLFVNYDEGADKLYITNTTTVRQYTLKVPRKLYTQSYDNVFFTPNPAITIKDVSLSNTGDRLYLLSDATPELVYQYDLELPWNIGKNTPKGTYNFNAYGETVPVSMYFKRDGTKFYIIGQTLDRVLEFNMTTAWNVTTAYQDLFYTSPTETAPQDIYFSNNGTKMYTVGTLAPAKVNEYDLSIPWESGTATYTSNVQVVVKENTPTGIYFNTDGTNMYIVGSANDSVHQYTLSTAWDVSSASFLQTKSISAQETVATSIHFSNTGNRMFVMGSTGDDINQYDLTVNYDISTANFVRLQSIAAQDVTMQGMYFKPDGTQLFLVGSTTDTVYSYNLTEAWNVATISLANTKPISAQQTVPNGIHLSDDGLNMYIVGTTPVGIHHYRLTESWNVATANYAAFSVSAQTGVPTGLSFANNGTKMFVMAPSGTGSGSVHQYSLSTPWSVGTATFESSSSNTIPLTYESSPSDLNFNDIGTKIFISGTARDIITTLELTEAWNVATIQVNPPNRYSVLALDTTGSGIDFNPDGSSILFTGEANDKIHQITLTESWNLKSNGAVTSLSIPSGILNPTSVIWANNGNTLVISTATQVIEYQTNTSYNIENLSGPRQSLVAQDTAMNDVYFKPDGTSFYTVSSTTTGRVHQYDMNVAWQVTTANYARVFSVTTQETFPTGIWFRPEGNSMYVVGTTNDTIYQYNLSTAWNIGTATYSSLSLGVGSSDSAPQALCFSNDGTKLYITGTGSDNIREYTLSTPWSLSSATLTRSTSILDFDTTATGLYIDPTSSYMAIVGQTNDNLLLYSFGESGNIATLNPIFTKQIINFDTGSTGVHFKSDGSILYLIGSSADYIHQISLTESWNVNAGYYGITTLNPVVGSTTEVLLQGVRYANNGYDLYALGATNDSIYQYKLSEPYKANSGVFFGSKSITNLEPNPTAFTIVENCSLIYVIGSVAAGGSPRITKLRFLSNNNIYTLQTDYLSLSDRDTDVRGIALSNNNNELIVVGDTVSPNLHRYSLANSNSLSSATYTESVSISPALNPNKVLIEDSQEKSIFVSSLDGNILEYVLLSPNTLSGAQLKGQLNVSGIGTVTTASFMKPDGSKIYTLDTANDKVYQYSSSNNFILQDFTLEQEYDFNQYGIKISSSPTGSRLLVTANSLLDIYTNEEFTIRFNFNPTLSGLTTPVIFAFGSSAINRSFIALNNTGQLVYYANSGIGALNSTNVFTNGPIQSNSWYHFAFVKSANSYSTFLNGELIGIANTTIKPTGTLSLSIGYPVYGAVAANAYGGLIVKDFEILANQALYTSNFSPETTITGDYISKPIEKSANTILLLAQSPDVNTDSSNNNLVSTTAGLVTPEKIISNTATSLFFSNTGSNMYIFGNDNDLLASYDLSSSWNVSTASLTYKPNNSAVLFYTDDVREYSPGGIYVNSEGTDLYIVGTNGAWKVYQFTLNTPHDLSSISSQFKQFNIIKQTKEARGITFSPDGKQMYVCGGNSSVIASSTGFVYSYDLSTPWDISTAQYNESLDVTTPERYPTGIRFREDGTHMYVLGTIGADITPYILSTPWKISTATALTELKLYTQITSPTQTSLSQITSPQDFIWLDNGNYAYFIGSSAVSSNTINIMQHRSLNNAYSTGVGDGVITIPLDSTYYTGNISGISVTSDGKKMWAVDSANAVIQEFNLY